MRGEIKMGSDVAQVNLIGGAMVLPTLARSKVKGCLKRVMEEQNLLPNLSLLCSR
jgi:hypothetical protein